MIGFDSKRFAQLATVAGHWFLLLTVVVCVLRLPIPVLHHHDSIESNEVLVTHLELGHQADFALAEAVDDDLHWHLVWPWCDCRSDRHDDGSPQPTDADPALPSAPGEALVSSASLVATASQTIAEETETPARIVVFVDPNCAFFKPMQPCGHPLTHALSAKVRVCAVLSVIRC